MTVTGSPSPSGAIRLIETASDGAITMKIDGPDAAVQQSVIVFVPEAHELVVFDRQAPAHAEELANAHVICAPREVAADEYLIRGEAIDAREVRGHARLFP